MVASLFVAPRTAGGVLLALLLPTLPAQSILPPPPAPAGNQPTVAKALLGKALFWDEQLSSSNGMACGSCHILGRDGTDPRAPNSIHPGFDRVHGTADDVHGSPGVARHDRDGFMIGNALFGVQWQVSKRRAPSVINAAYSPLLFLDGRATGTFRDPVTNAVVLPFGGALESQITEPLVSPTEMAHIGRTWTDVSNHLPGITPLAAATRIPAALQRFVAGHTYATLFAQVYGSRGVTPDRIIFAIATYLRTLVSDQSPFDQYLAGRAALRADAVHGLRVFRSLCAGCHTDLDASVLTTGPGLGDFHNIGVRPPHEDAGRALVTGSQADRGKFRVPGLRNVALRTTYFHNGRTNSLGDVIDFYARGGDSADNQDPRVAAMRGRISARDKAGLLALLHTLTDPRVEGEQAPFDRPKLWLEGPLLPTAFGTGAGRSGPTQPRISALGTGYFITDAFGVGLDNIAPNVFTVLMMNPNGSTAPTPLLGLPFYLAQTPSLVTLSLGFSTQSPDGTAYKSHVFHVPPAVAPPGTYWIQWLMLDPNAPAGVASSNGMWLVVP